MSRGRTNTWENTEHGSVRGYRLHNTSGEQACEDCRTTFNTYTQRSRTRHRLIDKGVVEVPLELLGALLWAAPGDVEEDAERVLGALVVEVAIEVAQTASAPAESVADESGDPSVLDVAS